MTNEPWASTKALSVYNALSLAKRDMTREELCDYLRGAWEPDMPADFVAVGVDFLAAKGFVTEVDGVVIAAMRTGNGFCRPLKRTKDDADLDWAEAN